MKSSSEHWNSIFLGAEDSTLGWYEKDLTPTFNLLEQIDKWEFSTIFIPGAGTSTLVDALLTKNTKLVLNDISITALDNLKDRLGKQNIEWICQDIARPIQIPIIDICQMHGRYQLEGLYQGFRYQNYHRSRDIPKPN